MKTIERISLDNSTDNEFDNYIFDFHRQRYLIASEYAGGKNILDIACGTGYGTDIVKKGGAQTATGIDIDSSAVNEAKNKYESKGLTYFCHDYNDLNDINMLEPELIEKLKNKFDLIVSFETIEHLEKPDEFLKTISKYLKINGILITSVPVTPSVDANPFHLHDFTNKSFNRLLIDNGFEAFKTIFQKQKFNPFNVKKNMIDSGREIRKNIIKFYFANPGKLLLRFYSTIRYGFVNIYEINISRKVK
jgi:2-polyprenyl-3-methyl-5-hydroxy-6-metoxy-1,4-benzoquinol methylase